MDTDRVVDEVIRHPLVMIASDGIQQHPRNAGTCVDPRTIEDKATYRAANAPGVGVRYLLVVAEGRIVEGVAPGRPLTSDAIGR